MNSTDSERIISSKLALFSSDQSGVFNYEHRWFTGSQNWRFSYSLNHGWETELNSQHNDSVERSFARFVLEIDILRNIFGFEAAQNIETLLQIAENIQNTIFQITDSNIHGVLTHICSTITYLRVQIAHKDKKIVTLETHINPERLTESVIPKIARCYRTFPLTNPPINHPRTCLM